MRTITIGIDLAKHVLATCERAGSGRVLRRREFRRDAFATWLQHLPPGTGWPWKPADRRTIGRVVAAMRVC